MTYHWIVHDYNTGGGSWSTGLAPLPSDVVCDGADYTGGSELIDKGTVTITQITKQIKDG